MRRYFEMIKSQMKENKSVILAVRTDAELDKCSKTADYLLFSETGYLIGNMNNSEVEKEIEAYAHGLFKYYDESFAVKPFMDYDRWEDKAYKVTYCFCMLDGDNEKQMDMVNRFLLMDEEGSPVKLIVDTFKGKLAIADRFNVLIGDFSKEEIEEFRQLMLEFDKDRRYYMDDLSQKMNVYIFGGGQIAECLEKILYRVGFNCIVIDENPDYTVKEKHPCAVKRFSRAYDKIFSSIVLEQEDAAVVVTRGFEHDELVEYHLAATQAGFIGVLRNERKKKFEEDWLMDHGVEQEQINRIKGIEMHSGENPYRLAVRIADELLDYRNSRC